jgi:hypothetical protein
LAFTGPGVFQTTLNWLGLDLADEHRLCRWWFFSSILLTMPDAEGLADMAAITLSVSVDLFFNRLLPTC